MTELIQNTNQLIRYGRMFASIVERAVAIHTAEFERKIPGVVSNVHRRVQIETEHLNFSTFANRPPNPPFITYGLDFRPSHSLGIENVQALFALNPETSLISRAMQKPRDIMVPLKVGDYAVRLLDLEEASSLVDYAAAPHLDDGTNRSTILRVTPEDEAFWTAQSPDEAVI
jgi:hypothetical protein